MAEQNDGKEELQVKDNATTEQSQEGSQEAKGKTEDTADSQKSKSGG